MNHEQNPFSPGAGAKPPALAGRDELLAQSKTALARLKAGRHDRSQMIVGLRGVGKTVLLNRIEAQADALGYKSLAIEAREEKPLATIMAPALRRLFFDLDRMAAAGAAVKSGLRVLRSFLGVVSLKYKEVEFSLEGEADKGSADSGDLENDLPQVFLALGRAAAERQTACVLIIDELQYVSERDLAALLVSVHALSQKGLPVTVVGAGLPQLVGNAGRAKSYAERLFQFPELGPLSPAEAKLALQEPMHAEGVAFSEEALDEIVRVTHGYAYFVQEWGYIAWNAAEESPIGIDLIRKVHEEAVAQLDKNFFRVRFDRLTPAEEGYLRALAELPSVPQRSGAVAAQLGRESYEVSNVREALIGKGMIFSPSWGLTAFTVPLFDEYMKRRMPLPAVKGRRARK